jgi:hypothetical protein
LSKSDAPGNEPFLFDDWVVQEFTRSGGFTALLVLMRIDALSVVPLRSTYVHIIGDETRWAELSGLLSSARVAWNGVLIEPISSDGGGPVDDLAARVALRALERRVIEDRMTINEGHFFDAWGRRLKIEEAEPQ